MLVDDRHRRVEEHAPLHLDDRGAFGRELLDQVVGGDLRLEDLAAGEDVHGRVPILRPRVDRQVGFCDDDDSADAERVELVEDDVDDGRLGPLRSLDQGPLDRLKAVDGVRVAIEHLEQKVSSQSVQASGPPFDPFIYRTSPATFHSRRYYAHHVPKKFRLLIKTCFTVGSVFTHCKKKTRFRLSRLLRSGWSELVTSEAILPSPSGGEPAPQFPLAMAR